jgi:hypothetical protein
MIRGVPGGSDEPPAVLPVVDGDLVFRGSVVVGEPVVFPAPPTTVPPGGEETPPLGSLPVAAVDRGPAATPAGSVPGRAPGFETGTGPRVVGVVSGFAPLDVALWARTVSGLKLGTPEPVVPPMLVPPKIHSSTSPGFGTSLVAPRWL